MNKPFWFKNILRSPEDEGGGGGVIIGEGAQGDAPASTRNSKIEDRLDRMATAIDGMLDRSQTQAQASEAEQRERQITGAIRAGEQDLINAEKVLAEAYDEGEGADIAKAQRIVAQKAARLERINAVADDVRSRAKADEHRDGGTRSGELDTGNLDNWKASHSSWYGVNKEMTKFAHEMDAQIRENGVLSAGSKEYFNAIDRQMKQRFPDQFAGSPQVGSNSGGGSGPSTGGAQLQRISASVAEGYRRMGINVDDPVVAKRMVANRAKAVAKGWLPEREASGRILSR